MADHTIQSDERGAYEFTLAAGDVVTVDVRPAAANFTPGTVQIFVHSGTRRVYAMLGSTVTARDPKALMIPEHSFCDMPLGPQAGGTIALVSEDAAVVSVCRP